jgi:membrane-associated protease RseP (regulator of RpoE activity)
MMDRLRLIGHPIVVFVLICAFAFVYFFYLKGGNPLSGMSPSPKTEVETERNVLPPNDPNAVPFEGQAGREQELINEPNQQMAGLAVQQQNSINQPNRQNLFLPPNQPGAPRGNPDGLPAQPNQSVPMQPIIVPDLALIEGHWIGGEVIPLTAMIAKANSIPPDVVGVLFDEVTLLSAEAGLMAGDVVTAINGRKVTDLKSFQQATKEVAQSNRATVSVYSGGRSKDIIIFSAETLGMAQMEAAPMILATDRSPHSNYGPCNKCHAISKTPLNTGQLAKDQGDNLTKVAPTIRKGTPPPHSKRGTCTLCHVVL